MKSYLAKLFITTTVAAAFVATANSGCAAPTTENLRRLPESTTAIAEGQAAMTSGMHWWNDAVVYEIFVRSFQDSNGDGVGDLDGITSRLPYLQALGINAIWLTPIFKSPSYHGYDATDFKVVNADFGTLADFDKLVAAAHARGIRVVLDIAVNHTSIQHPWFKQFKDRYVWAPQPQWPPEDHWHKLGNEYYWSFFSPSLPDLNWHNPAVLEEVDSILDFWSRRGVDGFRLDAARYYVEGPNGESDTPETHQAIHAFADHVRSRYPNSFFVGEVWASKPVIASYVNSGDQLDLAFDFPGSSALIRALETQNAQGFGNALRDDLKDLRSLSTLAPFLTNHDMVRAPSFIANSAQLKLAALALLTLPGTPFIYYGEEIGLPNARSVQGDLAKRTPMQWDGSDNHGFTTASKPWNVFATDNAATNVETQAQDHSSLLTHYRALLRLRKAQPVLRHGDLEPLQFQNSSVAGYMRALGKEAVVTVINFGKSDTELKFAVKVPNGNFSTQILWGAAHPQISKVSGGAAVTLQPLGGFSASVFKITLK